MCVCVCVYKIYCNLGKFKGFQSMNGASPMVQWVIEKIPWSRKWHPTPVFLPGESHAWEVTVHVVADSQTLLSTWYMVT